MNLLAVAMIVSDRFAALVRWLKKEPVAVRVLGAMAVTTAARFGIRLNADQTLLVAIAASSIAGWASRRKVHTATSVRALTAAAYDRGVTAGASTTKTA